MNAVTTKSRPSARVPAAAPIKGAAALPYWYEPTMAARDVVCSLILSAKDLELAEDDECSDALRVLQVAATLPDFGQLGLDTLSEKDPQNHVANAAFDVAALLNAGLHYPKQWFGHERRLLLGAALRVIDVLTLLHCSGPDGPALVPALRAITANPGSGLKSLDPQPRDTVQASQGITQEHFNGHTAEQAELVLGDIATHANTLRNFVRDVPKGQEENAFEMVSMGLQIIGAAADALNPITAVGAAPEWLVGRIFYSAGKAVQA